MKQRRTLLMARAAVGGILGSAAFMAGCTGIARPAAPSDDALIEAADGYLLNGLNRNAARERYLSDMARPLREADREADGLDRSDVARARIRSETRHRSGMAMQLLQHDFDGDLKITKAEIMQYSNASEIERREREADTLLQRYDANKDGVATLAEALAVPEYSRRRHVDRATKLLELDQDHDERLTADELLSAASRVFDHFDVDRSGVIDEREYTAINDRQRAIREQVRLIELGCTFPKASARAQIVAYGVYESDVVSTAWVGSPDTETGVIDVTIEPGSRPLYLLLNSYDAMIWRFSGATDRIERVLASSYETGRTGPSEGETESPRSAVAAIGIDADRFVALGNGCQQRGWRTKDGERKGVDRIGQLVAGRPVDVVAGAYSPVAVALPSGTARAVERKDLPAPRGFEPQMWREALRFTPGGIERIDPGDLATGQPVGTYEIMPEQFGLAQLLARGALERAGPDRLLLTRKIAYWPSGLAGAHSTNFIVRKGVTPPAGRPGHSCVMSEADALRPDWRKACRDGLTSPRVRERR